MLLVALLATASVLRLSKRRGSPLTFLMLVALAVPHAAYATTIGMANSFVNGEIADADEVNENFGTLVTESNLQDGRLDSLESASAALTHPGGDITTAVSNAIDADTVDGAHAAALEESAEIDADISAHAGDAGAHHSKTTDASELTSGVLSDSRLSVSVSQLGSAIDEAELSFDPATQTEFDDHSAKTNEHHTRYGDAEAVSAADDYVLTTGDSMNGALLIDVDTSGTSLTSNSGENQYHLRHNGAVR